MRHPLKKAQKCLFLIFSCDEQEDGGVFLETFKGASQVYKRSLKGVSREFQDSLKNVFRKFQGCLKKVSSFKGVSRMFQ